MAALKIAKLGNPILRQVAQPVDLNELTRPGENAIQAFMDDMIETMRAAHGAGLAAPQVSRSIQIVVLECLNNPRYPGRDEFPLTVLVNPRITRYGEEEVLGWESCLSLIDFRGLVPRSKQVTVDAHDRFGEKVHIEAEGFPAVALQHEIDHLNGIIFLERMADLTQLSYQEEFETYWLKQDVAAV
ncbi:MAG: peptide deformylase [Nitrospinae bacterium]|nr:peptide deformylase [Nitrospinota bacterium]